MQYYQIRIEDSLISINSYYSSNVTIPSMKTPNFRNQEQSNNLMQTIYLIFLSPFTTIS